jgi:AcrR family transcriptional regulator
MEYAFKSFTSLGFTQVTMDDIARGVGMGKGTVYKLFPSKEALIMDTIDFFASRIDAAMREVMSDDTMTPVEKLKLFIQTIYEKLKLVNPAVLVTLERIMPEAYEKIEKTRQRIILSHIGALIEEGKEGGIFESQIDGDLVAHILIGSIRHLTEAQVISSLHYSVDQLFTSIISIIMKGCMTEEGRKFRL